MSKLRRKKYVWIALALAVVIAVFAYSQTGLAAPEAVDSQRGSGIAEGFAAGIAGPFLPIIILILSVVQGILVFLLSIAAHLLNLVFMANIDMNPANMEVVQQGWRIVRDIANAFFILIILWIAFTIIFNFENLGGRKLLVRVIVVALLINFSLVMVTTVFGFANILAGVFAKPITANSRDVAGMIIDATKVQTVVANAHGEGAKALADAKKREAALEHQKTEQISSWGTKDTLLAAVGVKKADAQFGALGACALGFVIGGPPGCGAGLIAGGIAEVFTRTTGLMDSAYKLALSTAFASLALLLATIAMALAAIALLVRMIAMIVLSILAPAALMIHAIPGKGLSKYFNQWLEALLRYAFFAPMFYFLFWLTLFVLQRYDKAAGAFGPTVAGIDIDRILQLLVAIGLLWAAVKLSRKTGGVVAETAIDWGKKLGLVGLGFAGRMAMPAIGAAATTLGKGIAGIESPAMRRMLALPLRGLTKVGVAGRRAEEKAKKPYEGMSAEERANLLDAGGLPQADRLANMREMLAQRELGLISKKRPDLVRETIEMEQRMGGDWKPYLRSDPNLAEARDYKDTEITAMRSELADRMSGTAEDYSPKEAAIALTIKNMRPEHYDKNWVPDSYAADENDFARQAAIVYSRGGHYNAIDRYSPAAAKAINEELNIPDKYAEARRRAEEARAAGDIALAESQERLAASYEQAATRIKNIIKTMDPAQYKTFKTGLLSGAGIHLPSEHDKPPAIAREEVQRLELRNLRDSVRDLENAIRDRSRLAVGSRGYDSAGDVINRVSRAFDISAGQLDQGLQRMKQQQVDLEQRLRTGRGT